MESVALTYAKALFSLSLEEDQTSDMMLQVNEMYQVVSTNSGLIKLLDSKSISKDEKKEIVKSIFENKINRNLYNFIKLLIDKSRVNSLSAICLEYKKVYYNYYKIKEAKIYSAFELSSDKVEEIKVSLEEKYSSEFVVENLINKDLIAGVKIVIGDLVIDGSIDNKLKNLKDSIIYK